MNDQSAATACDYNSHTPPALPAVVRPSRAPLPRLNEGAFRRAARVLPFGAISNLRAGEVPRVVPFNPDHQTSIKPAMKNLRQAISALAISFAFLSGASAQQTITQWTFEGDVLTPSTGSGTASNVGGTSSAFAGGDGGGRGWNTSTYQAKQTNSGTAGVQFLFSTFGFTDLTFSFAHRASGTASRWAQLDYTIDGGTNWTTGFWNNNGGLTPHDTFYTFNVDFSSINNIVSDQAGFGVRIVSIFSPQAFNENSSNSFAANSAYMRANNEAKYQPTAGSGTGQYGTTGTWRFDNVTLSGSQIPAPGAKDLTWNIAGSGNWNASTANWTTGSGSTTFANADTVTFNNTAGGTITVEAGGVEPATTTISAASGTYTFNGGAIGGGALTKSGNGTAVLSASNAYTGGTTITGGVLQANSNDALGAAAGGVNFDGGTLRAGGEITGSRNVTVNAGGGTIDNNGHNVGVASVTGAGNFTKAGAGTLVVAGALAGSSGGQLSVAAGALQLNSTGNIDFNVDSSGTSFAGDIILQNAGRLRVTSSGTVGGGGKIFANTTGGTITLTGSGLTVDYANDIVLANGVSIAIGSTSGNTVTYSGNISGGEDIRFSNSYSGGGGAGTTIISGQNTYGGQTRFHNTDSGVVVLSGGDNRLPTGTTLVFGGTGSHGGSTLDLNGNNQTVAGIINDVRANVGTIANTNDTLSVLTVSGNTTPDKAFSGSIAGNIALVKTGSGTQTLSGANTFTGGVTINGGALSVAADGNLGGAGGAITLGGGTLAVTESFTLDSDRLITLTAATTSSLSVDGTKTLTFDGDFTGSGALDKTGLGTLALGGSSIGYTGNFGINQGVVQLTANNVLANALITQNGGILEVTAAGDVEIGGLAGGSSADVEISSGSTAVVGNRGGNQNFQGAIRGQGGLRKEGAGDFVLSGNNDFTGAAVVSGGRLTVAAGGSIAAASSVTAQSGSELRVNGRVDSSVSISSGALLSGSGEFGGLTTIAGTHNPGNSPGLTVFEAGLEYNSTAVLNWELSANTNDPLERGALYDGINVTGGNLSIALGATLNLVFTAPLLDNTPSTVSWNNSFWDLDRSWTIISFAGGGTSTGDFNLGSIGLDINNIALASERANASFSIDRIDNDIILNYQAVPEPSTYALLALTGLGVAAYRWRRRARR